MRFRRLDLLRYGHFTEASLELPDHNPDLHIVVGPNEAGKSTALAAIEDLLFGIPHNSPLNFLHDYASMRIGAVLERDGEALELRRRKGNKDTLLTADDLPIPTGDGALAPFLAGADRSFLTRMFSLDHARLDQGGREILEARDEIGQMLFSAGTGLSGLRATLTALAEEADQLWAPRRAARRKYPQAEDRLKQAEADLRAHTLTASTWQELQRADDAARESYDAIEKEIEAAFAEQRKLGRIRRVYRNVRRQAELDAAIAELGAVTTLPEDALQKLQAAERADATSAAGIETLRGQLDAAREERLTLTCDETLLLHGDDIEQLHERRINVRSARIDLPQRKAELAHAKADLERLAAELDWDASDVEQLIGRIPARAKVTTARSLLTQRGGHLSAVENARAATLEADARAAELEREQETQGAPADVATLTAVTKATREMGDLAARISAAAIEVENAQADLQRWLGAMTPPVADEAALGALAVPPRDGVQHHRDRLRALDQRQQGWRDRVRAAEQELDGQRKAHERLARDEETVAAEDLSRARAHRDAGWSLIRRRHVDGASVPDEEMAAFAGTAGSIAAAYETAVRASDDLADRRFDKAEAAARLTEMSRQLAARKDLLGSLAKEGEALDEERRALDRAWRELWTQAAFEPLPPDSMLAWLDARTEALDALGRRAVAERKVAALRQQEADARAGVLDQLAVHGTDTKALVPQPLAVVLEAAAEVLREHLGAAASRRHLDEAQRAAAAHADRRRKALERVEAAWSEWQGKWADALAALGLDAALDPDAVAAQVDAIDEMRISAAKVDDLRHKQIGKIVRDLADFTQDVARLVAAVAVDLTRTEPDEAVLQLESRLAAAKSIRDQQRDKDNAIADFEQKIAAGETARRAAGEAIGLLQEAADTTDLDQLRAAIGRSDRLRALSAERTEVQRALGEQGDGLSDAALAAECRDVDLDQASARETSLTEHLAALRERQLEARENRAAARQAFEAVGGDDAAARAAAARQEALAEMREVAEEYARVRSAGLLLQWAIERYRREKQAPLLKRAARLFATLTGDSFNDLRVDFDDQDQAHLIGVRPDGATVAVPGMSTGTADQLYLALRIASVSDYLERASALPFVADDLFINFDDARAAAGFEVLGALARTTQVLFFTHHRHLVEIARASLGGSLSIVSLGDATSTDVERRKIR